MSQTHGGGLPAGLFAGGAAGAGAYGLAHANTVHSHSNSAGSEPDYYPRSDGDASHYPPSNPTNATSSGGYSYGTSPYTAVGAAVAGGYANQQHFGPGQHPSPGPSLPSTGGSSYSPPSMPNPYTGSSHNLVPPPPAGAVAAGAALPQFRSAKEREAYLARHRLREDGTPLAPSVGAGVGGFYTTNPSGLAVPDGGAAGGAGGAGGASASGTSELDRATSVSAPTSEGGSHGHVVVHQDGGRVPEEDAPEPNEIPPTYDSIQRDT
jgi:hypothetical protein